MTPTDYHKWDSLSSGAIERREIWFEIDSIRHAVVLPIRFGRESWDFGRSASIDLTAWLARLPSQGTLTVGWPATWQQHLKHRLAVRWPHLMAPIIRRWPVRMTERTYRAVDYVPAVALPENLERGRFRIFWEGRP